MSMTMLDVTLHIDEDTTHDEREDLRDVFLDKKGVIKQQKCFYRIPMSLFSVTLQR